MPIPNTSNPKSKALPKGSLRPNILVGLYLAPKILDPRFLNSPPSFLISGPTPGRFESVTMVVMGTPALIAYCIPC